ncbi:MAG: amidohydrolase [Cyclobacteriaceae bacterium]
MKKLLLLLPVLAFACTSPKPIAPDLILVNGKVWTGVTDSSFAEAVAIKGNLIVAVGKSDSIKSLAGEKTDVIDLQGKLVTAGFNDAHIHFLSGSKGLTEVDLNGTTNPEEVVARINEFAAKNPERAWITGRGWQYTSFKNGLPDFEALQGITTDKPVFIKAYDGHSAWANRRALELAGVSNKTVYTDFGELVKDKHGALTGALREHAMGLVSSHIPPLTRAEQLAAIRKGLALAASLGITSVQDAGVDADEFSLFAELFRNNEMSVRFAAAFWVDETNTLADIEEFTRLKDSVGSNNPMFRADAIKFMIDGVIESHTGYMLEPYSDIPKTDPLAYGQLAIPIRQYDSLVSLFDKRGFRIFTHAIGDKGVRESLNAYEHAARVNGKRDSRHRIEHIETISADDVPRFASLGVMASMEPIHADPGTMDVWIKAIGQERLPHSFGWADMLNDNVKLVYSSDWPACIDINPIRGIHVAVNRRTPEGFPENGWIPEQKISMAQALKAYTSMGAYSSFEEKIKGTIEPGKLADLVVLSQDLFTIDPMKTYETNVVTTIFNGKIIYH